MIPGQKLFGRRARITIGALQSEDLRVVFRAKKSLSKEPNTCEVTIYNLSADSRAKIQRRGDVLTLEAGYEDLGTLFSGNTDTGTHERAGPDWLTKLHCGDGEQAYQHTRISMGFKPGTRAADVVKAVGKQLLNGGIDVAAALNLNLPGEFSQGYAVQGNAAQELDKLLKGRGYEWSIQDGKLQILQTDRPTNVLVVLSESSGLIGSPTWATPEKGSDSSPAKPRTIKFKSLLNHLIRPGCRLRISSQQIKTDVRVTELTHSGDTSGQDWYTEGEGVPVT